MAQVEVVNGDDFDLLSYAATVVVMRGRRTQRRTVFRHVHEPRELPRCAAPASSNEERGRGWIARGALRRSLGCLSLRVGTLCCEVLKGGSLRIRILELGHCRHLCDGRISDR